MNTSTLIVVVGLLSLANVVVYLAQVENDLKRYEQRKQAKHQLFGNNK